MNEFVMETGAAWIRRFGLANLPTLEVGSYDVNGSLRSLFTGPYWGVDMSDGPGVDQVVASGWTVGDLDLGVEWAPFAGFGCAVWTEAAEHDPDPWHTAREIARALAPGGLLLATTCGYTADGRCAAWHSYPFDLYRFSPTGWRCVLERAGFEVLLERADASRDYTVAALARKPA